MERGLHHLELDLADAAQRAEFTGAFARTWPEFAQTDEEFLHEVVHGGVARRWLLRASGDGPVVGAVAVERNVWDQQGAPPMAFVVLDERHRERERYRGALVLAARFAVDEGFEELRVLAWDREHELVELLTSLPGWAEVERDVDVGLDLATASGWEREPPDGVAISTLAERPDLERSCHACLVEAVPDIPGDEPHQVPPFDEWSAMRRGPATRDEATFVAVDESADEVLGVAELEFQALLEDVAWNGFTAVRPTARRRGIARALKAAAIAYARDAGFRQLRTENERRNAPMRAINAQLGYQPLATRLHLRGPVAPLLG